MDKIKHFTEESIEKLKYYVYMLIDPRNGKVFYIGKGKGNRVFNHVEEALEDIDDNDIESLKIRTIREIKNSGLEVIHIIHRHNMDESTAFEVEAALIDAYSGLSNLQSGHGSNDYGPINSNQVNQIYSLPVIDNFDKNDKLLLIKLKQENIDNNDGDIYKTVRYCWKLSEKRNEVKQVAAVVNGIIKEVYEISGNWTESDIKGRFEFNGKVINNSIYKNKRIPDKYRKKGSTNPIQYTF